MTLEQAEVLLTLEEIRTAKAIGKEWGHAEAEIWRDQHPESDLPEWTMGTYCGDLPDDSEEIREAYEMVIDCAARDAWNDVEN